MGTPICLPDMKSSQMQQKAVSLASTVAVVAAIFQRFMLAVSAQPSPEFSSITRQSNGDVQVQLRAESGVLYTLQSSPDLVQWRNMLIARSSGMGSHTDSAAPLAPNKFYRAYSTTNAPVTGDTLATDDGEVVIHPINHATIVLGWKSTVIYVDPVGAASQYAGLPPADVVLVTHEHGDHLSSTTINSVARTNAALITSSAVFNQLPSRWRALARA